MYELVGVKLNPENKDKEIDKITTNKQVFKFQNNEADAGPSVEERAIMYPEAKDPVRKWASLESA